MLTVISGNNCASGSLRRDSSGHPDLIEDRGRCHAVRWRVTRCLDQRGHKPIHDDAGQLRMYSKHVRSVAAVGRNFAGIAGFIPYPGRVLCSRIVHELLPRAGGGDVEQFHRLYRGWVFVVIRYDEQSGQL
jgi:hypothetical protein